METSTRDVSSQKLHKQRLTDLNNTILPLFQEREALQEQIESTTDPLLKSSLQERSLLLRNQIVETVVTTVPDFLDAIVYSWNNSFTYDDARSYVLENLLEAVSRYQSTKKPFCRFTSFFWMYNKNLLRNTLKKSRAAKRDQRKTHSLDALISVDDPETDTPKYDTFNSDEDVFEDYSTRSMLQALYKNATPKQKQVLKRLYFGYSQSDIAKALGVTGTNINTVIRKLRKDLESML